MAISQVIATKPPNVLVLFADDMGINQLHISGKPYGYTGVSGAITTPHLAQFAAEGTTFMQWYSAFHVCTPSRASMMTGRLPIRVGLGDGVLTASAKGGLQTNETTMAEALGAVGYETAMFGKWHLGQREQYLPHNRGFSQYFGIPFSCDMGCSPWGRSQAVCGWNTNTPGPIPLLRGSAGSKAVVEEQPADLSTLTERYADWGSDFIKKQSAEGKPWLLYASFNHVHVTDANYGAALKPPGYSNKQFASPEFCGSSGRGGTGDAVQELDAAVGRLMAAVKAAGVDNNTIAFFTSDNGNPEYGDMLGNWPLRGYKASNWEGGIREPGIVRWPGYVAAGATSMEVATTYDIYPTVLSLAGAKIPSGVTIDGMDLSGVLLRGAKSPHKCTFHWYDSSANDDGSTSSHGLSAVRCGDMKAHFSTQKDFATEANRTKAWPVGVQDPPLLFNVSADPTETHNINPESAVYKKYITLIRNARAAHMASIIPVCSQDKEPCGGSDIKYAVCGDPDSKKKYPFHPRCTISPKTWSKKACN